MYYKQIAKNKLISIGQAEKISESATEINKEEYDKLLSEIREKADLVNKVYNGEISIDSVKSEWKDEISKRVEDRRKADELANSDEAEISDAEAMEIIMGVR